MPEWHWFSRSLHSDWGNGPQLFLLQPHSRAPGYKYTEQQGTSIFYEPCCPEQWHGVNALNSKHRFRLKKSQLWQQRSGPQIWHEVKLEVSKQSWCLLKDCFFIQKVWETWKNRNAWRQEGREERPSISRSSLGFQNQQSALESNCQLRSPKSIKKQKKSKLKPYTLPDLITVMCIICRLTHDKQHTEYISPRLRRFMRQLLLPVEEDNLLKTLLCTQD